MKKALFFDIDGTLLDIGSGIEKIPNGVIKQIRRLQDKGYYLFVASGRPKAFISETLLDAGFDGYILCNGAHVEFKGKMILKKPLQFDKIKNLIHIFEQNDSEYILECDDYCYLDSKYKDLDAFYKTAVINEDKISYSFNKEENILKTLKLEVLINKNREEILKLVKEDFSYDDHGTNGILEIFSKDISKANGISKVLEYLNIDRENSYAFGDGLNDIEMIEYVGCGIAMGNAVDKLKEKADLVCGRIEDNGLEKILIQLFEENEND
jgi:hypothetical protein